jgi:cytochrome b
MRGGIMQMQKSIKTTVKVWDCFVRVFHWSLVILFLMSMVAGIGITGWMLTLDAFWGNATVENTHVLLVNASLIAVAIHVTAAIYESLRHRENLILSMVTGNKPSDEPASASQVQP